MAIKFFRKLNARYKIIIIVCLLLAVAGGLAYGVIMPAFDSIQKMKKDIQVRRVEIERKYQQRKVIGDISKKVEKIKSQISLLNDPFVLNNKKLEFITKLEDLAERNRIQQDISLMTEEEKDMGVYKVIPIKILAVGEFQDQLNYLIGLETLKQYINADYLKISSQNRGPFQENSDEQKKPKKVKMLIRANTYWAEGIDNKGNALKKK